MWYYINLIVVNFSCLNHFTKFLIIVIFSAQNKKSREKNKHDRHLYPDLYNGKLQVFPIGYYVRCFVQRNVTDQECEYLAGRLIFDLNRISLFWPLVQ